MRTERVTGSKLNEAWANYCGDLHCVASMNGIDDTHMEDTGGMPFEAHKEYICEWPDHCVRQSLTDSELIIREATTQEAGA